METSQPVGNPVGLSSTKSLREKRHRRWTAKTRRDFALGLLFISPWIVGFFAFTLYPMVASFIYGFTEYHIRQPTIWVGLQNYIELFQDKLF
jgi:multiple sugar transport system permease protein